ncbi:unnamed protein product [Trifolium pratense]|uniref:Uncharacterized protein n=1 Tax=Trifolium pratense TaxID=57577 RepID=A0ACB0KZL3_TRIPR|nr:unnamed protein product [Trifolium pratense]
MLSRHKDQTNIQHVTSLFIYTPNLYFTSRVSHFSLYTLASFYFLFLVIAILFLFLTRLLLLNEIKFLHADLPPPPIIAAKSPSTTKQSSLSLFSSQFQGG